MRRSDFGFSSPQDMANGVAIQADGKIIAAGTVFVDFNPGESSDTDFALARYNPDGTPDATFGNGGQVSTDFLGLEDDAFSVLIQPDGKIVAVGSANDPATFYDFAAVRYLSNGTIDTTFGVAGKVHTDFGDQNFDRARSAALQPDGRIVAAGSTSSCAWTGSAVDRIARTARTGTAGRALMPGAPS